VGFGQRYAKERTAASGLLGSSLTMGQICCPETSVSNYHYTLHNNAERRSSHLRGESLKTSKFTQLKWFRQSERDCAGLDISRYVSDLIFTRWLFVNIILSTVTSTRYATSVINPSAFLFFLVFLPLLSTNKLMSVNKSRRLYQTDP
jgi:hypothetical protein